MKKLFALLMFLPLLAFADEGMWLPSMMTSQTRKLMKELGLELTPEQLYNPNGTSLTSAIVSLGGGFCSGVVVSPDGLVFTNHHCGYDIIQQHSTVDHDYLRNGFAAQSFQEELPNPDLFISFLVKTEDVTKRVLGAIPQGADESRRAMVIDSISRQIAQEAIQGDSLLRARVSPFYGGSEFYLAVYKDYNDVRLVFAPPSSAGKFGGDTDNWMWPRHTCDFSVFRIYANKDNQPAEYSPDNVPYHPTYYAPVSLKGYQEGSFCMTMGYPGSTSRYLSSYGIQERMDIQNKALIDVRNVKLAILDKAMAKNDTLRIYADDEIVFNMPIIATRPNQYYEVPIHKCQRLIFEKRGIISMTHPVFGVADIVVYRGKVKKNDLFVHPQPELPKEVDLIDLGAPYIHYVPGYHDFMEETYHDGSTKKEYFELANGERIHKGFLLKTSVHFSLEAGPLGGEGSGTAFAAAGMGASLMVGTVGSSYISAVCPFGALLMLAAGGTMHESSCAALL